MSSTMEDPVPPDPVPPEWRELARASRKAGMTTAAGAAIVMGAFIYSAWKLHQVDRLAATKAQAVAELDGKRAQLLAEKDALDQQIAVAREQRDEYKRALETVRDRVRNDERLSAAVYAAIPLSAFVEVKADFRKVPTQEQFPQVPPEFRGDYQIRLEVPNDLMTEIDHVDYLFNHPSFQTPMVSSANPNDGFAVAYRGYGCIHQVIVTLFRRHGAPEKIDFDQCRALGLKPAP
jgi:hypothetical protein